MNTKIFRTLSIAAFFIFCIIQFAGCGNDSTVSNNNGGTGTLIFSLDSLAINLDSANTKLNDTSFTLQDAVNLRIVFDCSTNVDSINSFASFRLSISNGSEIYLDTINGTVSELNKHFVITSSGSLSISYFNLQIQTTRNNSLQYFIRLKNIKIFKT